VDASDVGADLKEILIPADRLLARVAELAAEIDADYAGHDLLLVGVLKGAVMIMADLARAMRLPVEMDWMAVSSYGSGTRSSGVVRILKDLDTDISGKHVLIVEDIVDSGLTLSWLVGNLRSRQPASLRLCVLLQAGGGADGRRGGLHGFRDRERVRGGVRPGLRRALPEPAFRRHPRATRVRRDRGRRRRAGPGNGRRAGRRGGGTGP